MDDPIATIVDWAQSEDTIRAVLLLGSRAGNSPSDALSDYDIALFCKSIEPLIQTDQWIHALGKVKVYIPEKLTLAGAEIPTRLVIYEGDIKVDFSLYPLDHLHQFKEPYKALINKDTLSLPHPDPCVFQLSPPTQEQYLALVNEFWFEAYHVSKYLKRGDLWSVKFRMAGIHPLLLKMIRWHASAKQNWTIATHCNGKNLQDWIEPEVFEKVGQTFAHFDTEDSKRALDATTSLFSELAQAVAKNLSILKAD